MQVTLQDQVEVAGEDSEAITTFLESKVERMIQKGRSRAVGGRPPMLPLIRLRVSAKLAHAFQCRCCFVEIRAQAFTPAKSAGFSAKHSCQIQSKILNLASSHQQHK